MVESVLTGDKDFLSGLANIVSDDPNDVMDFYFGLFQGTYYSIDAEELPELAHEEYRALEDLYATCNPPTKINTIKINTLRDIMQRYAEAHKHELKLTVYD